jgi:hypothetical protein
MGSDVVIYVSSFIKIGSGVQKLTVYDVQEKFNYGLTQRKFLIDQYG